MRPSGTIFTVLRARQPIFTPQKGSGTVDYDAKENVWVSDGLVAFLSHLRFQTSTVMNAIAMDGKVFPISVLPQNQLWKLPTYPDIASLSFSKAGWFLSSSVFPSFWCRVIPANNTDYSFAAVTALKRVFPCNVCVLRTPKQLLSFVSYKWILFLLFERRTGDLILQNSL